VIKDLTSGAHHGRMWATRSGFSWRLLLFSCVFLESLSQDFVGQTQFICTSVPKDVDICAATLQNSVPGEDLKTTVMQLRETVLQQKETIINQKETIRELTSKLARCESQSGGVEPGDARPGGRRKEAGTKNTMGDVSRGPAETLTEREKQEACIMVTNSCSMPTGQRENRPLDKFQLTFPLRTNYMYAKVKKSLPEMYALTVCMWLKSNASPGVGTPFSYAVPGQANELVLIEWGNNPMEILINDKVAKLPFLINDGKWHHICVTWTTRDGVWEAYQDGVKRGGGENLAPYHPIKPQGLLILGQEQDTYGGGFDATQAFVGDLANFHIWDRKLSEGEIYNLATCSSKAQVGNVFAWMETSLDIYGGASKWTFEACRHLN
uniref:Neuronal pentraxin 1 like n=1 Tax=Poecilia reticulata TaxID=8081 RepID=A0A3P9PNV0_POERE